VNKPQIKHYTERIPDIVRNEVYELDDLRYVERFDDLTGERMFGSITMYNGITVCAVNADGSIALNMPTDWVTNHQGMVDLVVDVERLDAFIAEVCKNYH
jgi:hypothetical protein